MQESNFIIFSGSASGKLAAHMARLLEQSTGRCTVERFPDGEINVHLDEPVRGRDVYLVQSTCAPVNDHLVELLALADACRRSSALSITAVVPYFGYARSDTRHSQRAPIAASMVASVMQSIGITHIVTVDLHAAQMEGFFHIPVDSLTAVPALVHAVRGHLPEEVAVVSPDEGRFKMASEYARWLDAPVAVIHKSRQSGTTTRVAKLVGDVKDRPCLIIDDMIATGGTIADAVTALLRGGARPQIYVAATHGLFVGEARAKLSHSAIRGIFVTDSITQSHPDWSALNVVHLAPLLAAALRRFRADESLADLYNHCIHNGSE